MNFSKNIILPCVLLFIGTVITSCEDYLDKKPESQIAPELYFTDASHLQAYADNYYAGILPSHDGLYGMFDNDAGTDNQIGVDAPGKYTANLWQVPQSGGDWWFDNIYNINLFFHYVLPKFGDASGEDLSGNGNIITGDIQLIKHYIGEMYFLRACEYFNRYSKFGDFPIITTPLANDVTVLTNAAKRSPRNEVARFILSDLDKAVTLMDGKDLATTRINKDVAILLKSRVALFEGTWLKYFKGTAFVPNGDGWPGKQKEYNADYNYPSGSIDNEIDYFLTIAMETSKTVAEKYKGTLTNNPGVLQQSESDPVNPYYDMFASTNLNSVPEALLWRQYAKGLATHNVSVAANWGNYLTGLTRGYVNNFLMTDGTPVYVHGSYADGDGYYKGDKTITDVKINRDSRLSIFLKDKGQVNIIYMDAPGIDVQEIEGAPQLFNVSDRQRGYVTGYTLRKGGSFRQSETQLDNTYIAAISYRAVEALLNYMEASYERSGNLDATAEEYWKIIRRRACVSDDIHATINATVMSKEAENDWGAYSAGVLIDPTLYNIRRERRCELLAEGFRMNDLRRWRALDQLIDKPYIPEGFHFWNTPIQNWYENINLITDGSANANMSPREESEYYRPYRRQTNQNCYDGMTWRMAHYLDPIMIKQFLLTAPDGSSIELSPIYQNPYWPVVAGQPAEK